MNLSKSFIAVVAFGAASIFSSCTTGGVTTADSASTDSTAVESVQTTGKIAYVRMDSLMSGYGLYIDLSSEFAKKQDKAQRELESKARSLEAQVRDFQEKAQKGLITTYQARTKQEELQKKEQQIVTYRENKFRELAEEEAVIAQQISSAILDYLKEYNEEKQYSMIMQSMAGNPVIIADPSMDITAEVLAELNKRYEATLESK